MKKLLLTLLTIAFHTTHPMEKAYRAIRSVTSTLRLTFSQASLDLLAEAMKENPSLEKAQELLDQGADPNVHDSAHSIPPYNLKTAMHFAAENNHPKLCLLLRKYGASLNTKSDGGGYKPVTPLCTATDKGCRDSCRMLLRLGALHHNLAHLGNIKKTVNIINLYAVQQCLSHSKKECQTAQKNLINTILCLKKACKGLPKDLWKLILIWCEDHRKDLRILLSTGIISLNNIPAHSQELFNHHESYQEKVAKNKYGKKALKYLEDNNLKNLLNYGDLLNQQYKDRKLRNSLPEEDTRFNVQRTITSNDRETITLFKRIFIVGNCIFAFFYTLTRLGYYEKAS